MATSILAFEQAFYSGDFTSVVHATVDESPRVNELQIRALLALNQQDTALARINAGSGDVYAAFKALVAKTSAEADALAADPDLSDSAKHILALKFAITNDTSKALQILNTTNENLDAGLLKVHLLLSANQDSEAQAVVKDMRQWANDHVAFNVAEALVSLRHHETAQKAYFIFEENNSMHPAPNSTLGEAVSQTKLRRFPEATLPMAEALKTESEAAVTSSLALALAQGDLGLAGDLRAKLQLEKYTSSLAVRDGQEKMAAFDRILTKYNAFQT